MVDIFIELWGAQPFVLVLWSFACFFLGNFFCATCYWYRIMAVMRRAEKRLEALQQPQCPIENAPRTRSTDVPPNWS